MKTVWIVGVSDCEGNEIKAVCSTKEIAEKEIFKVRDELITEWKEFCVRNKKSVWIGGMYKKMIKNLSSNNYEKWNNSPHERPYLYGVEVIEELK